MGDSNTVNLGAPIEHSWASQLGNMMELPCINLGMDGAGNDAIKLCYASAYEGFDVQEIDDDFIHIGIIESGNIQEIHSVDAYIDVNCRKQIQRKTVNEIFKTINILI